jgi:hypothetical protein
MAFRLASRAFPTRDSLTRSAKRVARRAGVDQLLKDVIARVVRAEVEQVYPDLVSRVRADAGIDATRQHLDEMLQLLDHRIDRLYRELARHDPELSFERPVEKRN